MGEEEEHIQKIKSQNELLIINNKDKTNKLFLLMILIGTLFLVLPHLNNSLWFDEAYSIALSSKSISEIWTIGAYDVHPVLYYIVLHYVLILFKGNIIAAKLFSIIPIIIMSILGYTHIRKDFGDRVGLLFSFFSFFSPLIVSYAGEIRMYTLGLLLVTLVFIYGYRILKGDTGKKNWILLILFSVLASYTHYYALFSVFIINGSLIVYFFIKTIKTKHNTDVEKHTSSINNTKKAVFSSIIELICFLPWLVIAINQAKQVSIDYWTYYPWIHDLIQTQITGDIEYLFTYNSILSTTYTIVFSLISLSIFGYVIYKLVSNLKNKQYKQIWPVVFIYIMIIVIAYIASLVLGQSIVHPRYLVTITGLCVLLLSFILTYENNTYIFKAVCISLVFVSITLNINLMIKNCSPSNEMPYQFVKTYYKEGDLIITNEDGTGFPIMTYLRSDSNIFYNKEDWQVEGAFKTFGRTITSLEEIKDYKGRVWIISSNDFGLLDEMQNNFDDVNILNYNSFKTLYKNEEYSIYLLNIN